MAVELDKVFYSDEKTYEVIHYLFYNFLALEKELFESFSINPLTEEGLEISSLFYANVCRRIYHLIAIGFQVHTFNSSNRNQIEHYQVIERLATDTETPLTDVTEYKPILMKIIGLREKNKKAEDHIVDYIRLYKETDSCLWPYFDLTNKIKASKSFGRIDYDKDIQPFNKKNWGKYLSVRNKLEHQGGTKAKLKVALNGLACLHLIMKSLSYASWGILYTWKSNIFQGVSEYGLKPLTHPTEF